ncbi:hypothetical protein PCASD_16867 [Puccinia coronata f. sp. avenae]|uniref:6-phosphogluconolactonase n=1 Tax=Puccinia coronata f. sp. avenae TaxID=200324 RepID=A0A2N5STK8_9BASI|nr:hypothetical protein PCASD_16867 [Puccinia coronata f. sp. avenae]
MNYLVFLCSLVCLASWSERCSAQTANPAGLPATLKLYVGCEEGSTKLLSFDTAKTELSTPTTLDALGTNVLWFEFDKAKNAAADKFSGKDQTGTVFSASVGANGALQKISSSPTDEAPVSIELSPDEKLVMVANFNGGSIQTYELTGTGTLPDKPKETFKFSGSGPVKERQGKASAHQVKMDPSGKVLLVPDLGSDRVHSFTLNKDLTLTRNPDIRVKAGCGPRHLVFSPQKTDLVVFYLLCELSNDLFLIELTDVKSKGKIKQTLNILPRGTNPSTFNAAEILITPDKKFLYTTTRQKDKNGKDDDNIFSVFARDDTTGKLTPAGTFPTGGKGPRHFSFSPDPDASLVVVSNQDSNRVNFHKRDPKTGALTLQRTTFESKTPVFAVFQA